MKHLVVATLLNSVLCTFLFGTPAAAFFPEYEHLTPPEATEILTPWLIDTEYQSDKLTYSLPLSWHHQWLATNNAFQYSAGSLGPKRFMTRGRMKLNKNISDRFFLQLAYVDRGGLENHRNAYIFELGYNFFNDLSLRLYGQPESRKSDGDVGLALEWKTSPQSRIRVYHTWVDFSYNERVEDSSRYIQAPRSYGVVWRSTGDTGDFQEWSLRHDTKSTRLFEQGNRLYGNQGLFLDFKGRLGLGSPGDFFQYHSEWARLFEQDTGNTDRGISQWHVDRASLWVQHANKANAIPLYGLKVTHNHWRSNQGEVVHNNIMPHLWYTLFDSGTAELQHQGRLGYEVTWHEGRGPVGIRGINDADSAVEHRLNFRYQMAYSKSTRIIFLLSFDADDLEKAPWEGGNMQFSTDF